MTEPPADQAGRDVDGTHDVVPPIGDMEKIPAQRDASWVVEPRVRPHIVDTACRRPTGEGRRHHLRRERDFLNTMIEEVRNVEVSRAIPSRILTSPADVKKTLSGFKSR